MYPINQVFVGNDPLLSSSSPINNISNIEEQIKYLQSQKQILEESKNNISLNKNNNTIIWNEIDAEILPMTNEQKAMLFQNEKYNDIYNKLQDMVQSELLNLVKGRIENSEKGYKLLKEQLELVKSLKTNILESTKREMEMFNKFKEFSKQNPNITYDDFLNLNLKKDGNRQDNK